MDWMNDVRRKREDKVRREREELERQNAEIIAHDLRVIEGARKLEDMVLRNMDRFLPSLEKSRKSGVESEPAVYRESLSQTQKARRWKSGEINERDLT